MHSHFATIAIYIGFLAIGLVPLVLPGQLLRAVRADAQCIPTVRTALRAFGAMIAGAGLLGLILTGAVASGINV